MRNIFALIHQNKIKHITRNLKNWLDINDENIKILENNNEQHFIQKFIRVDNDTYIVQCKFKKCFDLIKLNNFIKKNNLFDLSTNFNIFDKKNINNEYSDKIIKCITLSFNDENKLGKEICLIGNSEDDNISHIKKIFGENKLLSESDTNFDEILVDIFDNSFFEKYQYEYISCYEFNNETYSVANITIDIDYKFNIYKFTKDIYEEIQEILDE